MRVAFRFAAVVPGLLALGLLGSPLYAQQVYRIVGPDGRVTFSDKPPPATSAPAAAARPASAAVAAGTPGAAAAAPTSTNGGPALPFTLRQVVTRYPVVLYTGDNCGPCGGARSFLAGRGIPFSERTVNTNNDIQALARLSNPPVLPMLTIGAQQLKGFSDTEWTQFLDAAGYPKTSQLPSGYVRAAPAPLVAAQTVTDFNTAQRDAPAANGAPPAAAAPVPQDPPPNNPAGIRF